ncbi:MAG TPA: helix-turn-helix transcriptional regulator [Isosphaeraceae bacterium]|nr:helix-turn-helix transcriptional regulator [Isosphaeraceae bacterium]
MSVHRLHRKIERTPEDQAAPRAERERFPAERPSLDDLIASGEWDGPFPQDLYLAHVRSTVALKRERERLGWTLDEVARRAGLDQALLGRLERGKWVEPTLLVLSRYADALGMRIEMAPVKTGS